MLLPPEAFPRDSQSQIEAMQIISRRHKDLRMKSCDLETISTLEQRSVRLCDISFLLYNHDNNL